MISINQHIHVLPNSNELHFLNNGNMEVFQLEPLTMKVLIHLLNRREIVCTSNELIDMIWDGNIGVGGPALRKNIYKLRTILTKFGQRDLIETIPKKKYRFKGQSSRSYNSKNNKIYYWIGLLLFVVIIIKIAFPGIIHRLLH